jgi:hypothetical protein
MSGAERIAWGAWGLLSFIALIVWLRWEGPLEDQREVTPPEVPKERGRRAGNS